MRNVLTGMLEYILLCLFLLVWMGPAQPAQPGGSVTIGVLAKRGVPITLQRWSPTIDYLNQTLTQFRFSILPLDFEEIPTALESRRIDFLLANSAIYIQSEHDYRVFRIATLINRSINHPLDRFGGVIFTRKDNADVNNLQDLKGRSMAAVDVTSFGGYLMALREFEARGIDTSRELEVQFQGTHDAVVRAVLEGRAVAGTVRTDTLERMADVGLIELNRIKVLNTMHPDGFPYLLSTRLYPEWPMAALNHVPNRLVKAVSRALLNMPPDHPAALASKTFGWTVPANYQPVHDLFRSLNLPPHQQPHPKLSEWIRLHPLLSLSFIVMLLLLITALLHLFRLNHQLSSSQKRLARALCAEERSAGELKANMARLKESEEKFSGLAVSALDAIIMLDPQGRISFWNRAAERIFGHTSAQAIGLEIDQWIVTNSDNSPVSSALGDYVGNQGSPPPGTTLQIESRRRSGETFPAEIAISSVHIREGCYVICVLRDITYRLELESERRRLETELSQRHKMEALAQLGDGISHEINTPMQSIANNLHFLRDAYSDIQEVITTQVRLMESVREVPSLSSCVETFDKTLEELDLEYLTKEVEEAVSQSLGSTEQVKRIVRSLRVFTAPNSTRMQRTDLNKLVQDLVVISRKVWSSSAELQLNLKLPELMIDAYSGDLLQALLNLVVNAAQAIEDREYKTPGLIEISIDKQDDQAVIEVRDNGIGMTPEVKEHIFNPFFTTREQGKGSGQGLTLTQDVIVRKHNGKVSVHSGAGEGTVFTLCMPLSNNQNSVPLLDNVGFVSKDYDTPVAADNG